MVTTVFSQRHAVYFVHGGLVWVIICVVSFPLVVSHPVNSLLHPSKALFVYLSMTLVIGEALGSAIHAALRIADGFPTLRVIHIVLPLVAAACVGAVHAALAPAAIWIPDSSVLPLRPMPVRLVTALLLALVATPVIIIRSARLNARLGYRPRIRTERDARWRA